MLEKIDNSTSPNNTSFVNNQAYSTNINIDLDCKILAAIFISIGDAVIETDANAPVTRFNLAAEKLTGWNTSGVTDVKDNISVAF